MLLRSISTALLVAAVGCVSPTGKPVSREAAGQVRALLEQRAEALNAGDMAGYLSPVVPQSRDVEEFMAQRLLELPVHDVEFKVADPPVGGELPETRLRAELRYRFVQTADANTFSIPITYGFRDGLDGPVLDEVSIEDDLPPWFGAHTGVTTNEHFVALHRPDAEGVRQVLQVAQAARAELQQTLPFDLDERVVMVLARDDLDYQQVTGRDLLEELPRVAQSVSRFAVTPERYVAHSRHMVLNVDRLAREGTGLQTFKHELVHLALAPVTRPITPGWVTEGAAMYAAGQRPNWTKRVTTGSFESLSFEALSSRSSFGGPGPVGDRAGLEYAYAAGAAYYLTEKHGEDAFWSFYRAFADVSPHTIYGNLPGQGFPAEGPLEELTVSTTAGIVRQHFELTMQELDTAVRDYIADRAK